MIKVIRKMNRTKNILNQKTANNKTTSARATNHNFKIYIDVEKKYLFKQ